MSRPLPPFMNSVPEPAPPPSIVGQMVLTSAQVDLGRSANNEPTLVVTPHGSGFQVVIPMSDAAAQVIGKALLAKRVILPDGPLL